jgi:hypothetical protein
MKTYIITMDGLPLHYYGGGVYGWGERPSLPVVTSLPQVIQLVEFTMRDEAEDWLRRREQFGRGAVVQERGK